MLFFMTDNGISKISKGAKPKQYVLQKRFLKTSTTIKAMESSDWEESWVYCTTCIWKAPVTLLSWAVAPLLSDSTFGQLTPRHSYFCAPLQRVSSITFNIQMVLFSSILMQYLWFDSCIKCKGFADQIITHENETHYSSSIIIIISSLVLFAYQHGHESFCALSIFTLDGTSTKPLKFGIF